MPSTRDSRKKKKEFPTAHQIKKTHVTAARKGPWNVVVPGSSDWVWADLSILDKEET
jgi:hypothetical protein